MPFHKLSLAEQERRTSDVAERLKRLADKYIARIDSESGQSDLESPRGTIGGLVSPVRHGKQKYTKFYRLYLLSKFELHSS